MKKLFTTLALGAFGIAALQAQIFTVTVDGKAVNSGETITSNSIHSFANPGFDSSKPEDMSNMPFFTWELKPVMKINFASAASVVMTVTNNSDTYGLNDCGLTVGISSCQTINPGGSLETKHDAPEGEVEVNVEYNHVFNALDGSYIPLPTSLQLPYKASREQSTASPATSLPSLSRTAGWWLPTTPPSRSTHSPECVWPTRTSTVSTSSAQPARPPRWLSSKTSLL